MFGILKHNHELINKLLMNVFKAIRLSDKLDGKTKEKLLKIYHENLCGVFVTELIFCSDDKTILS